ncbi:GNAT family N-acetyltransferase [Sphingobacterium spiritivorum]|uniref:GNAT family N-acetyltransferase n=2 Tax=Sphingobacterium spiritivorum TaxID=258 RepID=UPI003DA2A4D7
MTTVWFYKTFDALTTNQLYQILKLRNEVFVVEQNCPYLDCDNKDQKCDHLWAMINNDIAAYARIVPAGVSFKEVSIGRVLSNPAYRKQKIGRELMRRAVDNIMDQYGAVDIRIGAQLYLKAFYESFGFQQASEEYLEDGIPHIEMLRKPQ